MRDDVRRITGVGQSLSLVTETCDAVAELVQRAGDVAILGIVLEVQTLRTLPLQQRQLDVVGEEEKLARRRHRGQFDGRMERIGGRFWGVRMEDHLRHRGREAQVSTMESRHTRQRRQQ